MDCLIQHKAASCFHGDGQTCGIPGMEWVVCPGCQIHHYVVCGPGFHWGGGILRQRQSTFHFKWLVALASTWVP